MKTIGEACDCPMHGPERTENCSEEHDLTGLLCSRPAGHDGPHSACSVSEHPSMVWPQDD